MLPVSKWLDVSTEILNWNLWSNGSSNEPDWILKKKKKKKEKNKNKKLNFENKTKQNRTVHLQTQVRKLDYRNNMPDLKYFVILFLFWWNYILFNYWWVVHGCIEKKFYLNFGLWCGNGSVGELWAYLNTENWTRSWMDRSWDLNFWYSGGDFLGGKFHNNSH